MIRNRIKNNLAKFGLYLACFPYFGLDVTDSTGADQLDGASISNILQIMVVFFSCIVLFILALRSKNHSGVANKIKGGAHIFGVLTFFAIGTVVSVMIKTPNSLVAWFRTVQFIATILLSIISIRTLLFSWTASEVAIFFLHVVRKIFIFVIFTLFVVLIISPNLALINTEMRGVRLGGSFIHPNTLGLGAVSFMVASYSLFSLNSLSPIRFFVSFVVAIIVIYLTDSSSASLIAGAVFFLISVQALSAAFRLLTFLLLFGVMLYFWQTTALIDIQIEGTWLDRMIIWRQALTGISSNFLIGVGPYVGVRDYFSRADLFGYFTPPHSHNLVLDVLLTRGIVFSVPLLILIAYFYFKMFFIVKKNVYPLGFGLILMVFAILTHGMFESSFGNQVKAFCHGFLVSAMYIYAIYYKSVTEGQFR